MIKMVLDKGLETERSVELDHIFEHPLSYTLVGSYSRNIERPEDFPDISAFINNRTFKTLFMLDDNTMVVPVCSGYDSVQDIASNYDSANKYYTLSITLGHGDAANE